MVAWVGVYSFWIKQSQWVTTVFSIVNQKPYYMNGIVTWVFYISPVILERKLFSLPWRAYTNAENISVYVNYPCWKVEKRGFICKRLRK